MLVHSTVLHIFFHYSIILIMAQKNSTNLCALCAAMKLSKLKQDLVERTIGQTSYAITLRTISHADFYKCASNCDICSVTASCFEEDINIWGERTGTHEVEVAIRSDSRLFWLEFMDKSNWHPVIWIIWEDDGEYLVESDPLSEKSLVCYQKWLNDCVETHDLCKGQGLGFMPTRLLDVGTTTSPELKLVLSASQTTSPYVTLSHCWGKGQICTTTSITIRQHMQAVPFSDLPPTFKDAVLVTRRLNLRLLWIDSLCIVQDDAVDWFREAAAMASIYGNAHTTIMASRSSSSEESFLEPRSRPLVIKEEPINANHKLSFHLVNNKYHNNSIYNATYNRHHALHNRAWVLQERFLSQRKLLFCKDQVYWECNQLATSEDRQIEKLTSEKIFAKLAEWFETVEKYTACDITYDKDVFPAMAGIARSFAKATNFSYCAGIWLDQYAACLLWYPFYAYGKKKNRRAYVAPTFSWASSQGPVRYRGPTRSFHTFCNLVTSRQVLPENSYDPFGALTSAAITLEGLALKVTRLIQNESGTRLVLKLQNSQRYILPVVFDHEDTECDPVTTVVLPLYDDESRIQALVLHRVSNEVSGNIYHRIGISWCSNDELLKMNWRGSLIKVDDEEKQQREFIQQVMGHAKEVVTLM